MDQVKDLKSEIFDILVAIDNLKIRIQQLDEHKNAKVKELSDLIQSQQAEVAEKAPQKAKVPKAPKEE